MAIMTRYPAERKQETRRRILAASEALMKARGVEAASVEAVMRSAGLTVGGFYAHFPSKEALASETLLHGLARSFGAMEAALDGLAGRDWVRGMIRTYLAQADDPDLVEQIRRLMFVFEDIIHVNDKGIQAVLKEVENDELSLALKTASEPLKEKIFRNMSERAAALIKEDMQYMGPVRVSDVEQAQQRIVDIVRRLEESGDLVIEGRGGEGETLV